MDSKTVGVALGPVIEALGHAANALPEESDWKWKCVGIRGLMAKDVGLTDLSPSLFPERYEGPVDLDAAFAPVVDAIEDAINVIPESSEWHWALIGMRRNMLQSAA